MTCRSKIISASLILQSLMINLADINECDSMRPCHINATCTDTLGSFICTCNNGFTGDGMICQSIIFYFQYRSFQAIWSEGESNVNHAA